MSAYRNINTLEELNQLVEEIREVDTVAVDIETTGLNFLSDKLVGIAVSVREGRAAYVSLGHPDSKLPFDETLQLLKPVLEDDSKLYIFHNPKFDTRFLYDLDVNIPKECVHDTLLQVFCSGEIHTGYGLKPLTQKLFRYEMVEFDDLFPKGTKKKNAGRLRSTIVGPYACEDADFTLRIHNMYYPKVKTSFIYKMECKLWPTIQYIETNGFSADERVWKEQANELEMFAYRVEEMIHDTVFRLTNMVIPFSLTSDKDLRYVLYSVLKMPVLVKTKGDQESTGKLAMEALEKRGYKIASMIRQYSSIQSAITLTRNTLPSHIRKDGKIHTSYLQHGAGTGRFSSVDPNIQNITNETEWTIKDLDGNELSYEIQIRKGFVADDGHYLVEFDFGQIEYIIMAYYSDEYDLVDAYINGLDIHRATAAMIYGIDYSEVTSKQRRLAKTYNFLIIYGGSAFGLALRSDELTEAEAEEGMNTVLRSYPNIANKMEETRETSKRTRSVTTLLGRRIPIAEFYDPHPASRRKAERVGINYIIQGTAADVQKLGLMGTHKAIVDAVDEGYIPGLNSHEDARMVAQTHDSQTWSFSRSIRPQDIFPLIMDAMSPDLESHIGLPRVLVDAKLGLNWAELVSYDPEHEYDWDEFKFVDEEGEGESPDDNLVPVEQSICVDLTKVQDVSKALADIGSLSDLFGRNMVPVSIITLDSSYKIETSLPPEDFKIAVETPFPEAVVTVES